MSHEFVYVVVDIGSRWVRGGLAGTAQPIVTLANNQNAKRAGFPSFMELNDYALTTDQRAVLMKNVQQNEQCTQLIDVYGNDTVQWMSFSESEDVELALHKIFAELFAAILTPLNRTRIMIVDGKFSILTKSVIAKVLVVGFGVKSVQFLQKPVMSCLSSNSGDGLVVDIGWDSCSVTPVVDHRVLQELVYEDDRHFSGLALHYRLVEALIALDSELVRRKDLFLVVEQFVEECVYVREDGEDADDVDIEGVTIPGRLKYEVVEKVFFGSNSIVDHVKRVIQRSPLDVRRVLRRHVVFGGGVSRVPGLISRVLRELSADGDVQAIKSMGAWQGASIYSSVSLNKRTRSLRKTQEVTKESLRELMSDEGLKAAQFVDPLNSVYRH